MDLGAYVQIEELEKIAKKNGIEVPRLRGYRLMSEEQPVDIKSFFNRIAGECCCNLIESDWGANDWYEFSERTKFYTSYYTRKINGGGCEPRWDRIHGFKRKKLKFEIKKQKRAITKQYETYNKYCGRNDILYIHARIGGGNWSYFGGDELKKNEWFLEKVDDAYDSTYCDIYAKINRTYRGLKYDNT